MFKMWVDRKWCDKFRNSDYVWIKRLHSLHLLSHPWISWLSCYDSSPLSVLLVLVQLTSLCRSYNTIPEQFHLLLLLNLIHLQTLSNLHHLKIFSIWHLDGNFQSLGIFHTMHEQLLQLQQKSDQMEGSDWLESGALLSRGGMLQRLLGIAVAWHLQWQLLRMVVQERMLQEEWLGQLLWVLQLLWQDNERNLKQKRMN